MRRKGVFRKKGDSRGYKGEGIRPEGAERTDKEVGVKIKFKKKQCGKLEKKKRSGGEMLP